MSLKSLLGHPTLLIAQVVLFVCWGFFPMLLHSQTTPAGCNYYNQPCYSTSASICQSTDDVVESIPSSFVSNGLSLNIGGTDDRQSGLRFKSVSLPNNAIVKNAFIQFYGGWASLTNGTLTTTIHGENMTHNSVTFTNTVGTIANRTKTTNSVTWVIPEYVFGAITDVTKTADVSSIINEFIADGWTNGMPMTFFLDANSNTQKILISWDSELNPSSITPNGAYAPNLVIEYTIPVATCSGISGLVYTDFNDNGNFDVNIPDIYETGIPDVTVNIYDDNGFIASVATDNFGNWTYPAASGDSLRVEYIYPSHYEPAKSSSLLSSTETAFIYAPECCIDFGLHESKDYLCEEPQVLMICNVKCTASNSGSEPTIISFAESDKANSTNITDYQSTVHPIYIEQDRTGSLYGLSYNKKEDVFYAGAHYHTLGEIGSAGTGGIYCVDNSGNDGTDQSVNSTMVSDMISLPNAGIDPSNGTCMADNANQMQYAAKIGLGDLDINCTNDTIYTINLNTQQLVAIPVDGCSAGIPVTYSIPTPTGTHACTGDEIRPFGIKYHQGKVYIGAVCNATNTQNTDNLWAYVFEYTEGNGINSTPVLDFPLDYTRVGANFTNLNGDNAYGNWLPWQDDFTSFSFPDSLVSASLPQFMYPQPVLTDIEFDNGDIILSFTDRFPWQFDNGPDPTGTTGYAIIASVPAGDILRAGNNGNNTWTIENNATVIGQQTGTRQTTGAGSLQGIGDGEYYHQDGYVGHTEVVVGGLAQIPGNSSVIAATYDPTLFLIEATGETRWSSGGANWYNNTNGEADYAWEGYYETGTDFGKGNGFGDVEYICDCAPIEIGNRVWHDEDADGIQDPTEPPIANVVLQLYDALGTLVGTTPTDADGRYYFNNMNVNLNGATGLDYLTQYYIAIAGSNLNSNGDLEIGGTNYGELTQANNSSMGSTDLNDSDGIDPSITSSGIAAIDNNRLPYISVITGDFGENNFTLDFGFDCCIKPDLITTDDAICSGESIDISTLITDDNNVGGIVSFYSTYTDVLNSTNPLNSPVVSPITTTEYYIREDTVGCFDIDSLTITVHPLPTADAGNDVSICNGSSTILNASGGTTYAWSPSTGLSNPNIANPTANPTATTTYTVTVTDANNCSNTDQVVVTANPNPLPTAIASSDVSICNGSSTNLSASGGTSYAWSPSDDLNTSNSANPIANPTSTTTYTVTVTDANNCSDTDIVIVTVLSSPVVVVEDVIKCTTNEEMISATVSGGTGDYNYSWNGPFSNNPNNVSSFATSTAGIYTVTVEDSNGCIGSDSGELTIQSKICLPVKVTIKQGPRN